jgi:3'-5' exoribonuclease
MKGKRVKPDLRLLFMNEFVKDLKKGQRVSSSFSVKYRHPPANYRNGYGFVVGLADRTGEVEAIYWGKDMEEVNKVFSSFEEDDVVSLSGVVEDIKGKPRISITSPDGWLRKEEKFELERFVMTTKKGIEQMKRRLLELVDSVKNPDLKELLNSFFRDESFFREFCQAPAAMYIHHPYIGGLLEHTLNVAVTCSSLLELYPQLDGDLVLAGSLLHDIGKMKEFVVTTNIKISEEGMLRGHIPIGEEMLRQRIKADFPEILKLKLSHILLAHHGKVEYNSPVTPKFPEALLIYYADEMDAQLFQYLKIIEESETEDFHVYSKRLGQVYLK